VATITRTTTRSRRSRSYEETNRDNLARALGEESLPAIGGLARRSGNYAFPFSKSLCACAPTYTLLLRRRPIHLVVLPYAVNTSPRRSTALHPNTLIPPGDAASTVSNSLIRNQHATKRRSPLHILYCLRLHTHLCPAAGLRQQSDLDRTRRQGSPSLRVSPDTASTAVGQSTAPDTRAYGDAGSRPNHRGIQPFTYDLTLRRTTPHTPLLIDSEERDAYSIVAALGSGRRGRRTPSARSWSATRAREAPGAGMGPHHCHRTGPHRDCVRLERRRHF